MAPPATVAPPRALAEGLDAVHGALLEAVKAEDADIDAMASHLITAGGKRQRPAFVMATSMLGGETTPSGDALLGGVSVELVHLGSLYHDDVMDEAQTRHHVESVNHRFGNLQAILAGDYLLAKASEIAAGISTEVAGLLAATIGRLCEGQLVELQDAFQVTRSADRYERSIAGKTAALFRAACRIGAIVGDLPRDKVEAYSSFGLSYGMAFQIVDDVLDVVATDEELGKPAGNDLVEGTYTLPVLRALEDPEVGPELRSLLGTPISREQSAAARELVKATDGVKVAAAAARVHADAALAALGPAVDLEAGAWLADITRALVARVE